VRATATSKFVDQVRQHLDVVFIMLENFRIARMLVPKFVCEVICASVSASFMDGDVPWDTRSITQKARLALSHWKRGI
jgi:hypothetical protein